MINKKNYVILIAAVCCQCTKEDAQRESVAATISLATGFPRTLKIYLSNKGKNPFCVFKGQIDSSYVNLSITQKNNRIFSEENVNGPVYNWKSINILEDLYIIPPGGRVFFFDLSGFKLQPGQLSVDGVIKVVDCRSIFDEGAPEWKPVPIHANIQLPKNG